MKHFMKKTAAAFMTGVMLAAGAAPAMATSAVPGFTCTGNDDINKLGKTPEPYVCAATINNGSVWEYEYDEQGHLLSETDGDTHIQYSYDYQGHCIEQRTFLDDGTYAKYMRYTCDDKGRRILAEDLYDEFGWGDYWFNDSYESQKQRYTYDNAGRLVSIIGEDDEGRTAFVKKFEYDGNFLSSVTFEQAYIYGKAEYHYNAGHTKATVGVFTTGLEHDTFEKYRYQLDEYGNIILMRDCELEWTTKNVLMPLSEYLEYKNVKGFSDVSNGAYYRVPVKWAVHRDITKGISDTDFAPNMACTRGQIVTFLWRAAGQPKAYNTVNKFADVQVGAYYDDAVQWAVEQGITTGTSDTTFSPNEFCTRAQAVTFLWRAAGNPSTEDNIDSFWDVAYDDYYYDAVQWAVEQGITNGISDTMFSPYNTCTRGQIVTFLYRGMA